MTIDLLPFNNPTSAAGQPISCGVVHDDVQAEALRPVWLHLLERAESRELTQSPDWLLTWWRIFGALQGREFRLGLFHEGDRLVGLAPLVRRRHWYRGVLPFRRLEFLASGELETDGIYSNHLSILAERGAEAKVADCFVDAAVRGLFGSWDEVVLPMMSGDTPMPQLLVAAFRAARIPAEARVTANARYVPLPATWDLYRRSLPKNERHKIDRALRAFEEWSQGTTELECISTCAELERGKETLVRLHHQRWARDKMPGVFHSPLYVGFHDRMMRLLAERGDLEILILRARGEPIAAVYNLVWGSKVYTYQGGRRTDLPAHLSPGKVLDLLAIRRAIEKGRREFDLLADDAFFKKLLTPHARPLVQVRAARPSIVERLRSLGVSGLARLRAATKRFA